MVHLLAPAKNKATRNNSSRLLYSRIMFVSPQTRSATHLPRKKRKGKKSTKIETYRIFPYRLNRSPHIDNLISSFQKSLRLGPHMMPHAVRPRFVRLIDMHPLHRPSESHSLRSLIIIGARRRRRWRWRAPDSMIEDKDLIRTSPTFLSRSLAMTL